MFLGSNGFNSHWTLSGARSNQTDWLRARGDLKKKKKKLNRIEEAGSGTTATLVSKSGHRRVPSKEPLIGCSVVKAGVIGHVHEWVTTRYVRRDGGVVVQDVPKSEAERYSGIMYVLGWQRSRQQRERGERARGYLTRRIGRAKVVRVRWSGWYQSSRYTSTSTMDTARRAVAAVAAGGRERRRASARYGGRQRMNGWGGWNPEWISVWVPGGEGKDMWMVQGNLRAQVSWEAGGKWAVSGGARTHASQPEVVGR
jgi:hypothetical protein